MALSLLPFLLKDITLTPFLSMLLDRETEGCHFVFLYLQATHGRDAMVHSLPPEAAHFTLSYNSIHPINSEAIWVLCWINIDELNSLFSWF